ncbi:DUF898 family protein [Naumannella sp. ID2617S]|nr:DUF898 family protein [Naumannella sp. ID2617S]
MNPAPGQPATLGVPLSFKFTGGALGWFGTQLLATLVTMVTLGICLPWAVVIVQRWHTDNTYVNGQRMHFTGTAMGLFGKWIKWWFLTVITVGIYSFWVYPRMYRWVVENQKVTVLAELPPQQYQASPQY